VHRVVFQTEYIPEIGSLSISAPVTDKSFQYWMHWNMCLHNTTDNMSPHVIFPPKQRNRQIFLNTVFYQEYQTMAGVQKPQINLQNTTQLKKIWFKLYTRDIQQVRFPRSHIYIYILNEKSLQQIQIIYSI